MNLSNAILADSSGLLALLNVDDLEHQAVRLFANANLIVPSTVLCEVDLLELEAIRNPFFLAAIAADRALVYDT